MNEKDLIENEEFGRWILLLLLFAMPNKNFEEELKAGNCDENNPNGDTEPKQAEE